MDLKKKYSWKELEHDPPFDDTYHFPVVKGQEVVLLPEKNALGLEQIYCELMRIELIGTTFKVVETTYGDHPTRLEIRGIEACNEDNQWVVNPWNIIPVENVMGNPVELALSELKSVVYD